MRAQIGQEEWMLEPFSSERADFYTLQARRMLAPVVQTIARMQARWGMDELGEQTE